MDEELARIRVDGKYSLFSFRDKCLKFRTSTKLKKYLRVKQWDNGYLVVDVGRVLSMAIDKVNRGSIESVDTLVRKLIEKR